MDRLKNPFAPGAGTPPPELVGRDKIFEDAAVTFGRIKIRKAAKSFLLVGLRGVGKTVLLNRLKSMSVEKGYRAESIEAPEHKRLPELLTPKLKSILYELDRGQRVNVLVKRALATLKSFAGAFRVSYRDVEFSLGISPETGVADSGDLENDLPELLVAVAAAGASRDVPIAIFIDEMQYLTDSELSALIMSVHKIAQEQLPLLLVGAGLPQLVGLTGKCKSYAERLFEFPNIGPLNEFDSRNALVIPVRKEGVLFEPAALDEITRVTKGYPYFIQEWGYQTWNLATRSPISLGIVKSAHATVTSGLDTNFFRVRFDRLTPRERDYLRAMAELGAGPHRSGDIADLLQVEVRSIAPVRGGLIKKGMIFSPAHGDTAFTVPLFDEFMKRTIPSMGSRRRRERHVPPE